MADIFFSYKREDQDRIHPFYVELKRLGFDVAWDQKILTGDAWENWILSELVGSGIVLVFWSHGSIQSDYVKKEARLARDGKKLLPVFIDALSAIEKAGLMGFDGIQFADLSNWKGNADDPAWLRLVAAIEDAITPEYLRRQLNQKNEEVRAARLHRNSIIDRDAEFERQLRAEGQARNEAAKRERQALLDLADAKEQLDKIGLQAREAIEKLKPQVQGREEAEENARQKAAEASRTAELLTDAQKQLAAATSELEEAKRKLASAQELPAGAVPPPILPARKQRNVMPLVLALACGLGVGALAANALRSNSTPSSNEIAALDAALRRANDLQNQLAAQAQSLQLANKRVDELQKQTQLAQTAKGGAERRDDDLQKQIQSVQAARISAEARASDLQKQLAALKDGGGDGQGDAIYKSTRALQLRLHALGYYTGAIDGIPGMKLEAAIKTAYPDEGSAAEGASRTVEQFKAHVASWRKEGSTDQLARFFKSLTDDKQLVPASLSQRPLYEDVNVSFSDGEARWAGSFPFDGDKANIRLQLKGAAFGKLIVLDNGLNIRTVEICKRSCADGLAAEEKKILERTEVMFKNCGSKFCFSLENFARQKNGIFEDVLWMRLTQVNGLPKSYSITTIYK